LAAAIETILSKRSSPQTDKIDADSFIELLEALRAHVIQEFSREKNLDQIFDDLKEKWGQRERANEEDH
jgi:hypothetical protein